MASNKNDEKLDVSTIEQGEGYNMEGTRMEE